MENEIIFKGTISLEDKGARELLSMLDTRITTINERTKNHTLEIKQLKKKLKEVQEG